MKKEQLKRGSYYWVKYENELFIAQFEVEYFYTDIMTPVDEFLKSHEVIEEINPPKGYENLKIF